MVFWLIHLSRESLSSASIFCPLDQSNFLATSEAVAWAIEGAVAGAFVAVLGAAPADAVAPAAAAAAAEPAAANSALFSWTTLPVAAVRGAWAILAPRPLRPH